LISKSVIGILKIDILILKIIIGFWKFISQFWEFSVVLKICYLNSKICIWIL
jgi:hypothetical protein